MNKKQSLRGAMIRLALIVVVALSMRGGIEISTSQAAQIAPEVFFERQTINGEPDVNSIGTSVAIDGETAVVGCGGDQVGNNIAQGSAMVYVLKDGVWRKQQQLIASDGAGRDYFGSSVAVSGDTIVVNAPRYGANETRQGVVYVFARSGSTWTQQAKLTAADEPYQYAFGFSVSIRGDQIAVGAPNALQGAAGNQTPKGGVYLFTRTGSTWTRVLKLGAADGEKFDGFGGTVSLSGNRLAVSAAGAQIANKTFRGAVYIYEGAGASWQQRAKLNADEGGAASGYGSCIALDGDTLLVGSAGDESGGHALQGKAFVYAAGAGTPQTWALQKKLEIADGAIGDRFGLSVALSGETALIGANNFESEDPKRNAVYVFSRSGDDWTRRQKLEMRDAADSEGFGQATAIDHGVVFVGDYQAEKVHIFNATHQPVVVSVSAASYRSDSVASESIVSAFGKGLATEPAFASTFPLPTSLAGTTVSVRDSAGVSRPAPLFFVAPDQINLQIPPGTAIGFATILIDSGNGTFSAGETLITWVEPSVFTADSTGQGVAAGLALRIRPGGDQVFEPIARFDPALNRIVPIPIDLGPEGDQVFLLLFGTGVRNRSALAGVTTRIGGEAANVIFAGAAPGFVGLDQANIQLKRSLKGRGELEVNLTVDGRQANPVRINVL